VEALLATELATLELATLELELEVGVLLATLLLALDELEDATELATLEELALAAGPTEHHADVEKLLVGKAEPVQAKLSVLVA
jgi:hypothetical protein